MLIIFSAIFSAGYSQTIIVPDDKPTIQDAINISTNGDTVLVKEGTYYENIDFSGKNITVGSYFLVTGDTTLISQTIIDADSLGCAVAFKNNETHDALLSGFTLINGTGEKVDGLLYGGAIYCSGASPLLDHLHIIGNSASGIGSGCGGGAFFNNSQAIISNSVIMDNSAYYGGGIRCNQAEVTIVNTIIKNNFAISGGGVMFRECPSSFIRRCIFTGNQAIYGGAVCCSISSPVIDKTTCFKNKGLYGGRLNIGYGSNPDLVNSICWKNSMHSGTVSEIYLAEGSNSILVAYSDIEGGQDSIDDETYGLVYWLDGNINVYPEFTDSSSLDLNLIQGSPCIDAGTDLFVNGGDTISQITDYYGNAPDMGAFEYQSPQGIEPLPGNDPADGLQVITNFQTGENSIVITITREDLVNLSVWDMQGRIIIILVNRRLLPGNYYLELQSSYLKPAVYLIRMNTSSGPVAKKFITY